MFTQGSMSDRWLVFQVHTRVSGCAAFDTAMACEPRPSSARPPSASLEGRSPRETGDPQPPSRVRVQETPWLTGIERWGSSQPYVYCMESNLVSGELVIMHACYCLLFLANLTTKKTHNYLITQLDFAENRPQKFKYISYVNSLMNALLLRRSTTVAEALYCECAATRCSADAAVLLRSRPTYEMSSRYTRKTLKHLN